MLLDTNAYSALANDQQDIVDLVERESEIHIPLPVVAELRYGFLKGSRAEENERLLQRFLSQPSISIAVPTLETTTHYARLQLLCQQRGKALSQNDIWIAALAFESKDALATYERDFEVFKEILGNKLYILGAD